MYSLKNASKLICTILFCFSLAVSVYAQTKSDTTTLVFVGTIHNATKNFTEKTLYNILLRVKPDIILVELEPTYFTADMIRDQYRRSSLENKVVMDYFFYEGPALRPYDIEYRNEIYAKNNYFNLQKQFSEALSKASDNKLLNEEAGRILQSVDAFGKMSSAYSMDKPDIFNSLSCDTAMSLKHKIDSEGLQRIVELTPSLKEFDSFIKFKNDFWVKRNNRMIENICMWTDSWPGKTIVVLCGFEHRYLLIDGIKNKMKDSKVKIRDYQSY